MKCIQRSISFLLALVMVFGMLPPMEVHAEEPDPTSETEAVMTVEETTVPTEAVTEPAEETTAPTESVTESTHEEVAPKEETVEEETDAITVESVIISQAESNAVLAGGTVPQQEETVLATSIEIAAETDCIAPGETMQLTATVLPENAADKTVIWSSRDESVLTVDENGLVMGVASGCTFVEVAAADGSEVEAQYEIAVFDEDAMFFVSQNYSSGIRFPVDTSQRLTMLTYGVNGSNPDSMLGNKISSEYDPSEVTLKTNIYNEHHGTNYFALDISGAAKDDVYPIAPGKVLHYRPAYGELVIEHSVPLTLLDGSQTYDKWYSTYVHMAEIPEEYKVVNKTVNPNVSIGKISNISTETIPKHLHFSITTQITDYFPGAYHWREDGSSDIPNKINNVLKYAYATINPLWIYEDFKSYSTHTSSQSGVWIIDYPYWESRSPADKEAYERFLLGTEYAPGNPKNGKQYLSTFEPDDETTFDEYMKHVVIKPYVGKYRPTNGGSITAWKFPWKNSTGDEDAKKWGNVSGDLRVINAIQNHVGNTWYEIEPVGSQRRFVHNSEVTFIPGNRVTFDTNGGTLKGVASDYHVESYKGWTYGALPEAERDGYDFLGWYTDPTGGNEVNENTTVSKDMEHTLYAHWDEIKPYYDHDQVKVSNITDDNAVITAVCYNPEGITLEHGGFQIREKDSTDITTKTDDIVGSYQTKDKLNCSYDLKNDYDIILEPGTTYEYRLYVQDSAGNIYYCCDDQWHTFTTTGTAPSEPDTSVDPPETISAAAYLADYAERVRLVKAVAVPADGDPITTWKLPWTNNSSNNLRLGTVSGRINLTREVINHVGNAWYEYDTGTNDRGFIPANDVRILLKRTITLDANGGSCSTKEIILVEGEQKLNLPTPTRSDYIFDGWFTAKEGGTQYISGNTYNISKDITLYAHWTEASAVDPDVSISAADYLAQYAKKVTSINKTAVTVGSDPITAWKLPWTNTKNGVQDASLKLGTVSGGITLIREVVNHAGNIWYEYETGTSTRGFVYHTDVSFETVKPYCTVKPHSEPTEDNTVLYATWNNPSGITLTHGGFRLGTNPNNLTQYRENVASGWETAESIPCSYDLKNEYDVNLQPGTTYYYQFFIEAGDEAVYSSEMNSFTTAGKAYIVIDEAEYWITEDMVLTENILIAEGSSVYIDEGVTVTVPAGIELNIQGYMEVYGDLIFEKDGILTITDQRYRRLSIWWVGYLDVREADISGVPYGAVEIELNSYAEIVGMPKEMLFAAIYVYSTEDINAALAQASDYEYLMMYVDSAFSITNDITIPSNAELYIWQWDSEADLPSVIIPSGVTVTNNGGFAIDGGRFVVEEGATVINNDYAAAGVYGEILILGEFQQNGTFEGRYYEHILTQEEFESDLADCAVNGQGWIHENETVIHSDMTIDLGEKEFRLSKYGRIIVADGATLTVNSSMNTGCWDYGDHECGQIVVEKGGKLVINGNFQTNEAAKEVILEDGSYLKVNGCMVSNGTISIGKNTVIEMTGGWIGYAPRNNGGVILPSVTNISITTENSFVDPGTEEYVKLFISIDGASWLQSKNGVILGAIWTSSDNEIIDPSRIKECGLGEYWAYLGDKTGMVTLTATSIDGSGKTATITLMVGDVVENRITVDASDLDDQTSVWIDGVEYAVQTNGDTCYVDLPDSNAKTMIAYTYHVGDASDVHTQYPVSMKVWTLSNTDGLYTATRAEELDNILQYSGSSIRVTGKQGIRMITSIDRTKKTALTSDGLAGYTLKEYGTMAAWTNQMGNKPLVLGKVYAKSNYAYKKDVADPVFGCNGDLMQYTNVLVGFSTAQCKNDLAMRPYMILENAEGDEITLYGGIVTRSIGYIALQNKDTFAEGTEAYDYVWDIIRSVYGDVYDEVNAA